ncbi:Mlp family lipoprotein [Borrelia turicatae]|uniref:Mlp family lipoprotein n=1 Tax=Borrelia turicatae TaxID=142 RepID=UPI001FF59103|nr:Mlp family lipoprotein [Borrelia turicatae]
MDFKVNKNGNCNGENGKYGNGTNKIELFFRDILSDISTKNNNEEMFECLKNRFYVLMIADNI